ncbi:metallophosphoesterase [Desulfuribacillus stibiiarsenatis]|uniref:Metallophosphoesterase n=1 Tax=Desulfuribacillus stibiiarsenatis TaxID=1390249 RepID=A0A1E5L6Y7_9FIRM|nr:TIGR00282 family metallophosphoesterase [Desulfuribacillus stibiiarsenatis]OEH85891.1 metallophosphoesterase [Desulfuribacillus stibiiarsenatis]
MKILFLGDVVGNVGIQVIRDYLSVAKDKYQPNLIIANGENAAINGKGITKKAAMSLYDLGIDILTMGNHVWDQNEIYDLFVSHPNRIIRPANYPKSSPGQSYVTIKCGVKNVTIINISGQTFMDSLNCPFHAIDEILEQIPKDHYVVVDFHAEATSEKLAMGHYLTGRVTAVLGTHTHVQTSDAQILNKQTAYITDVGMVGCSSGVLGMSQDSVIKRFTTKLPVKLEIIQNTDSWQFSAVLIETESNSIKAKSIHQILERS